ncbi:hypothetical protein ACWJJH_14180 [Endozoicomonadaceae bacterium StTr2]
MDTENRTIKSFKDILFSGEALACNLLVTSLLVAYALDGAGIFVLDRHSIAERTLFFIFFCFPVGQLIAAAIFKLMQKDKG